jgi:hypothetical protein
LGAKYEVGYSLDGVVIADFIQLQHSGSVSHSFEVRQDLGMHELVEFRDEVLVYCVDVEDWLMQFLPSS